MDGRRILPLLLLLVCAMSAALSATSGRGVPNLSRLPRRAELNEFLVPPAPPQHPPSVPHPGNSRPPGLRPHGRPPVGPHSSGLRAHGPHPPGPFPHRPPPGGSYLRGPQLSGRTPRVASPRPADSPGYFATLMDWLNPFSYGAVQGPPHPGSPQIELPHPPNFNQPSPQLFNALPPPPPVYGKPPLHPTGKQNQGLYSQPEKGKNCNPCNKVPWVPMQNSASQPENFVYGAPPAAPGGLDGSVPIISGNHGGSSEIIHSPNNRGNIEESYGPPPPGPNVHGGFYGGFSHEIRTPDFSYNPPLPVTQDGRPHPINPLPNPHLYPGPMPPLFKAERFDQPPPVSFNNHNPEYLSAPPIEHNQFLAPPGVHPNPHGPTSIVESSSPNFHTPPSGFAAEGPSNFGNHHDILDHEARPNVGIESAQEYDDVGLVGQNFGPPESHDGDLHSSGSHLNQQSHTNSILSIGKDVAEVSGNKEFAYGISQSYIEQQIAPLAENVDFNGALDGEKQGEDLSSSSSIIKNSHITLSPPVNSVSVGDTIHFEESPVVDLSKESETSTNLSTDSSTGRPITFVELKEPTEDVPKTTLNYDTSNFSVQAQQGTSTESYDLATISAAINNSSSTSQTLSPWSHVSFPSHATGSSEETGAQDSAETLHDSRNPRGPDISYIPPSGQPGYLWTQVSTTFRPARDDQTLLDALLKSRNNNNNLKSDENQRSQESAIVARPENGSRLSHRQQGSKRNKQVQVIIPYTSQYTPLPFQQPYGDWKGKISLEQTQPRKVPQSIESKKYDYTTHELRKDRTDLVKSIAISQNKSAEIGGSSKFKEANNSIDVHRLQKNIDNWTIQEYSKSPTSSTVIPNPSRPYLSPSKKIPNEYLTTTESIKHAVVDQDNNVRTFALTGFSFNDEDNEESSSNHVESGRIKAPNTNEEKSIIHKEETSYPLTTKEPIWRGFSVSISPLNKERVYVVTPQTILPITSRTNNEKKFGSSKSSGKSTDFGLKRAKVKSDEFGTIEKAYQVLPQAVNNLAVASTGPETVPLWGIMEHEQFASPAYEKYENDEEVVSPVLYDGHSKVSRGKR